MVWSRGQSLNEVRKREEKEWRGGYSRCLYPLPLVPGDATGLDQCRVIEEILLPVHDSMLSVRTSRLRTYFYADHSVFNRQATSVLRWFPANDSTVLCQFYSTSVCVGAVPRCTPRTDISSTKTSDIRTSDV